MSTEYVLFSRLIQDTAVSGACISRSEESSRIPCLRAVEFNLRRS